MLTTENLDSTSHVHNISRLMHVMSAARVCGMEITGSFLRN